jgi:hypothetical protein
VAEPDDEDWFVDLSIDGATEGPTAGRQPDTRRPGNEAAPSTRPRQPPTAGAKRARKVALLVFGFVAVVSAVTVAVTGSGEADADRAYLARVGVPARQSQAVGTALARLLEAPGSPVSFDSRLRRLVSRQEQDVRETAMIAAPPRLRDEQQQALSAMQFRAAGIAGLLTAVRDAVANPRRAQWTSLLSGEVDRLITSDVIWHDFFLSPAATQVAADGVERNAVPASAFVRDGSIIDPTVLANVLATLEGHAVTGPQLLQLGTHGQAVTRWQEQLNTWLARQPGLTQLPVTGIFDAATQTATIGFQQSAKITADGVVGPMTRDALAAAVGHSG